MDFSHSTNRMFSLSTLMQAPSECIRESCSGFGCLPSCCAGSLHYLRALRSMPRWLVRRATLGSRAALRLRRRQPRRSDAAGGGAAGGPTRAPTRCSGSRCSAACQRPTCASGPRRAAADAPRHVWRQLRFGGPLNLARCAAPQRGLRSATISEGAPHRVRPAGGPPARGAAAVAPAAASKAAAAAPGADGPAGAPPPAVVAERAPQPHPRPPPAAALQLRGPLRTGRAIRQRKVLGRLRHP